MRTTAGSMPSVLARRWAATDRLVTLSLPRDAFATKPEPSLHLSLGDRTGYRNAVWTLDQFARPDSAVLGGQYGAWPAFGTLALVSGKATPAVIGGPDSVAIMDRLMAERSQWAELTVGLLGSPDVGGSATVGVLLRASGPTDGSTDAYLVVATVAAGVGQTRIGRVTAGVVAWLASETTSWRPGERLRGEVDGALIRAYHQDVIVLQVEDANPFLISGMVGILAARKQATDAAAIEEWLAGVRQEYVGVTLDMGDVSSGLGMLDPSGSPATWDMSLSNLQAIGGVERFGALVRHGRLTAGFDVINAPLRVLTAFKGGSAPLSSVSGKVLGITGIDEERVRLECGGKDANLEPNIDGKDVAVTMSAPPLSGPIGLPADPCAASPPPDVIPGPPPPPIKDEEDDDGGIEDPPQPPPVIFPSPLLGEWIVDHGWSGHDSSIPGNPKIAVLPAVQIFTQTDVNPGFAGYAALPIRIIMRLAPPPEPEVPEVHDYVGYRCFAPFPTGACAPAATGLPNNHFFAILDDAINLDNYPLNVPPPHSNPLGCHRCTRVAILIDREELPPPYNLTGKWF